MIRVYISLTGKKADATSVLVASSRQSAQEYIDQHPDNIRKRMFIKETNDTENNEPGKKVR